MLEVLLHRHVYGVGNLHDNDVRIVPQVVDTMLEHPLVRHSLSHLLLRRRALPEDNVAVSVKERRQMPLPVLPFMRAEPMDILKIICSEFCHCLIIF